MEDNKEILNDKNLSENVDVENNQISGEKQDIHHFESVISVFEGVPDKKNFNLYGNENNKQLFYEIEMAKARQARYNSILKKAKIALPICITIFIIIFGIIGIMNDNLFIWLFLGFFAGSVVGLIVTMICMAYLGKKYKYILSDNNLF